MIWKIFFNLDMSQLTSFVDKDCVRINISCLEKSSQQTLLFIFIFNLFHFYDWGQNFTTFALVGEILIKLLERLLPWNYTKRAYFLSDMLIGEEDVSLQSLNFTDVCLVTLWCLNSLRPHIMMLFLHTAPCMFFKAPGRRIGITIVSFFSFHHFLYFHDLHDWFSSDDPRRNHTHSHSGKVK